MRARLVAAIAAIGLFTALPAAALQPHTPVIVEADASAPVKVSAGDEFFIALASNPSTGYSWTQSIADGKILAYEGNVYQPPSTAALGAAGQQIFIYHANRSGSSTVTFHYARPFETSGTPAKTLTFTIVVK